jgi:signal recognition particle subunit SRP68
MMKKSLISTAAAVLAALLASACSKAPDAPVPVAAPAASAVVVVRAPITVAEVNAVAEPSQLVHVLADQLGRSAEDMALVIKSSQAQHGLRHGDYVRYRQYCSRRLHRVRKAVGFLHGKGRYVKKQLEPRMVKDSRFLLIPLYCAERAWAFAMALKREDVVAQPRLRFRLLHRLSKAAQWATGLAKLCAIRGDKRTALEAEAYAGFIVGNMHLERERWAQAISNFRRTKTICTELARVSMSDQAHLYTKVVAEVQPSIRFCAYNLRRTGEAEGEAERAGERRPPPGGAGNGGCGQGSCDSPGPPAATAAAR